MAWRGCLQTVRIRPGQFPFLRLTFHGDSGDSNRFSFNADGTVVRRGRCPEQGACGRGTDVGCTSFRYRNGPGFHRFPVRRAACVGGWGDFCLGSFHARSWLRDDFQAVKSISGGEFHACCLIQGGKSEAVPRFVRRKADFIPCSAVQSEVSRFRPVR